MGTSAPSILLMMQYVHVYNQEFQRRLEGALHGLEWQWWQMTYWFMG